MTNELHFLEGCDTIEDCQQFHETIRVAVGQASIFPGMADDELDYLARLMHCYRAGAGTVLMREGDRGDFLVLIMSGEVDIHKRSTSGSDHVLIRMGPGTTLGEMALIDGQTRVASCVAATDLRFAVLTRGQLDYLMHDQPALGIKLLMQIAIVLTQKLRRTVGFLSEHLGD